MITKKVNLKDYSRLKVSSNTESKLYEKDDTLIKIINKDLLDDVRIDTMKSLCDIKDTDIVSPLYLVSLGKEKIDGFAMKYYKDYMCLSRYIYSDFIPVEDKRKIIIKINEIFKKFEQMGFYYYDIHTDNFLIKNNSIKVIDTDSGFFGQKYEGNPIVSCRLALLYFCILFGLKNTENINKSDIERLCKISNETQKAFIKHAFLECGFTYFEPLDYIDKFDEDYTMNARIVLRK